MNGLFKKVIVGALAAMMLLSSAASVMANAEVRYTQFHHYDISDPAKPTKVLYEYYNGAFTGKIIEIAVTPVWIHTGFEEVYPYAGYSTLYLEGNKQNLTAYNNIPNQWKTQNQDYMWELKKPHYVWQRQQTLVNGTTWTWDFGNARFNIPDSMLLTPTTRKAVNVKYDWKYYGIGGYNNKGVRLSTEEKFMYANLGFAPVYRAWEVLLGKEADIYDDVYEQYENLLTTPVLSERVINARGENVYKITDAQIAKLLGDLVVNSKFTTAQFNTTTTDGLATKDIAAEYLARTHVTAEGIAWHEWDPTNDWDADTLKLAREYCVCDGGADCKCIEKDVEVTIDWTYPYYEISAPYAQYQYMVVNGIVMDGHCYDYANKLYVDTIVRYTGGFASPVITYEFAWLEPVTENGVTTYEVWEQRFVDGVPEVDKDGKFVYVKMDNIDSGIADKDVDYVKEPEEVIFTIVSNHRH